MQTRKLVKFKWQGLPTVFYPLQSINIIWEWYTNKSLGANILGANILLLTLKISKTIYENTITHEKGVGNLGNMSLFSSVGLSIPILHSKKIILPKIQNSASNIMWSHSQLECKNCRSHPNILLQSGFRYRLLHFKDTVYFTTSHKLLPL